MTLADRLAEFERQLIITALQGRTRVQAARELGISLRTMFYKIRRFHIGEGTVTE